MSIFKTPSHTTLQIEDEIIKKYEETREKQIIKRYHDDIYNKEKMIKSFTEIFSEIVGEDTYTEFMSKTGLSENMFYELRKWKGKNKPSSKSTLMSVCVGYDVGLQIAEELLRSQGSHFNPHSDVDSAYVLLLTEYRGKNIDECNSILKKLNIKESFRLGIHARKPKTSNKKNE